MQDLCVAWEISLGIVFSPFERTGRRNTWSQKIFAGRHVIILTHDLNLDELISHLTKSLDHWIVPRLHPRNGLESIKMHCEFNWNCDSKNLTPSGVTREIFPTWSPMSETYCLLNDILYIYVYKSIPSFFAPESSLRFPCLGSLSEDFWWKFLPWEVEKSWRWSCLKNGPKMVLTFEGEKFLCFPSGGGVYIHQCKSYTNWISTA